MPVGQYSFSEIGFSYTTTYHKDLVCQIISSAKKTGKYNPVIAVTKLRGGLTKFGIWGRKEKAPG